MADPGSWFQTVCARHPERAALVSQDITVSYLDLLEQYNRDLQFLKKLGVGKGQVVVLISTNCHELVTMLFAVKASDCVVVPIDNLIEAELEERIRIVCPDLILRLHKGLWKKEELGDRGSLVKLDPVNCNSGLVIFTSGSTGKPKAILHDACKLLSGYGTNERKSLCYISIMGFDHIGGLDVLFRALKSASRLVIPRAVDPYTVALAINKYEVEVLPVTPSFLKFLILTEICNAEGFPSIKYISYGAEPMQESLLDEINRKFPDARIQQKYGTSETGTIRITSKAGNSLYFRIDDPGVHYRIVEGELYLSSNTIALNAPTEQLGESGRHWYATGDLVKTIPDGYMRITGRKNEMINVGGQKVLPLEIESVLQAIPGIKDCMVYAVPNALLGEVPAADLVTEDPTVSEVDTLRKIRSYCRNCLEDYKIPQKVILVEQITLGRRLKKKRKVHFAP